MLKVAPEVGNRLKTVEDVVALEGLVTAGSGLHALFLCVLA